jgi:hypothetical protein
MNRTFTPEEVNKVKNAFSQPNYSFEATLAELMNNGYDKIVQLKL